MSALMVPAKRALEPVAASTGLIKGQGMDEQQEGACPAYSASGQDVWIDQRLARAKGPGIVLSAVGARCGKVFLANHDRWGTVANTASWALARGWDPKFVFYVLNREDFWVKGGAAQPYVRVEESLRQSIYCPSQRVQHAISDFLDRETAQIDELIAKQNALIELLGERRKAVITRAVTRGLCNEAPTRESHVGWLGSVPAHWEVGPLKRMLAGVQGGVSPQAEGGLTEGDEPGVLKSGCVNGGRFNDEEHKRLPSGFLVPIGIRVRLGDVLVCRASGSIDLVGSCAIVTTLRFNLILSDKTFRLTPARSASGRFLAWLLNSAPYRTQVAMSVSGAEGLANNLPSSSLMNFIFAIPPLQEQLEIAAELDRWTSELDLLTAAARRAVELLRERRAALITAAVTGKIDVRGAV